jgi:hypothetical protein
LLQRGHRTRLAITYEMHVELRGHPTHRDLMQVERCGGSHMHRAIPTAVHMHQIQVNVIPVDVNSMQLDA